MAESDIVYGKFIATSRRLDGGITELPIYLMPKEKTVLLAAARPKEKSK